MSKVMGRKVGGKACVGFSWKRNRHHLVSLWSHPNRLIQLKTDIQNFILSYRKGREKNKNYHL